MKNRLTFSLLVLLSIFITFSNAHADHFKSTGTVDVYFSPNGGATNAVVTDLNNARTKILVQAYSFTSAPIAMALVDASKRGVHIEVVLDRSQKSQKYSSADFVAHAGIPVFIDSKHAMAHNKIMIIDRGTLRTGSFNFTKGAEQKNAEKVAILQAQNGSSLFRLGTISQGHPYKTVRSQKNGFSFLHQPCPCTKPGA
jgi:phosphatidylserine/phosphatidylglycerophosphate/cardiolipin synthase-like enzyme